MITNVTAGSLNALVRRKDDPMVWAADWICECGQRANPVSADWRWNGRTWEHYHGYPIGHIASRREPPNAKGSATANEGGQHGA